MNRAYKKNNGRSAIIIVIAALFILSFSPLFVGAASPASGRGNHSFDIVIFWSKLCPHCKAERAFFTDIKGEYPLMKLHYYEVYYNKSNQKLFSRIASNYHTKARFVPALFIGKDVIIGFSSAQKEGKVIREKIDNCIKNGCPSPFTYRDGEVSKNTNLTVNIPLLGRIKPGEISLFNLTLIIGLLDGFNPCAMWVLSFLLTLLVYTRSRKKMLLIGGTFIFVSAVVYFIFMAAWLNTFLLVNYTTATRIIIALIAVFFGLINIKDFIWFKKGVSLTIPERYKPKLFEKMRGVVKESRIVLAMAGTAFLALFANSIELACTAGFPAIYTRILTMNNLPISSYYAFMALYNVFYVVPLLIILLLFVFTLGRRKMGEREGRIIKFIGGLLMLILGIILLLKPEMMMAG